MFDLVSSPPLCVKCEWVCIKFVKFIRKYNYFKANANMYFWDIN